MKYLIILFPLMFMLIGCGGKSAEDYMNDAKLSAEKGDYADAVIAYDKIETEFPESEQAPEALYQKATLYQNKSIKNFSERESLEKSVEVYKEVFKKYPQSAAAPKALFMAGFIEANDLKKFDEATKTYNLFLQKYPDNELAASAKKELDHMGLTPEQILEQKTASGT